MAKTTRFIRTFSVALVAILLLHTNQSDARAHRRGSAPNPRYASVIMDAQSGRVLNQQNPHASLAPASLTKMMTLFLTFEAIENGRLHMNKYLTVSSNAVRQPPSKLGLKVGERITVKQAILALVTRSANDVAYAVAETIGGSEARFTQMMTERARSLGMWNSYFANASGLPHPRQKSSAHDMAVLGRALMQYFPQHYHFFSTKFFTYKGQVITTHNNLIKRYKGMDGFKTGYTAASGFNLVSSAVRNNRRVIVSVFGGRSAVTRDMHVADLMDRGFDILQREKIPTQVARAIPAKGASPVPNPIQVAIKTTPAPIAAAQPVYTATTAAPVVAPRTVNQVVAASASTTSFAYPETAVPPAPDGGAVRPLQAPTQFLQHVDATPPAAQPGQIQPITYLPTTMDTARNWGIQIGAYSTPSLSQQALQAVQSQLKDLVTQAQSVIIPSVTPQGTIYRARIIGMTPENAAKACQLLSECMAFTVR